MTILALLLPLALFLALTFVGAFVWASLQGQYDDLETPAQRILLEEDMRKETRS